MTDLETLKAELARQDEAFEACFEQLRAIDSDVEIAVYNETLGAFEEPLEQPVAATPNWAQRI